jgi:hypothetical protein
VKFIPLGEKVSPAVSELVGSAEVFIPLDNPAEIERLKGRWRKQLVRISEASNQIIKSRVRREGARRNRGADERKNIRAGETAGTLKIFAERGKCE